jgi:FAD/FMN-containing dehydrogenase
MPAPIPTLSDEPFAAWNRAVPSHPAAVVQARTAEDVAAVVRQAADRGLTVAVRSTGHGAVPLDPSTVLVHTGAMDAVSIDPDRRVAQVQAGARWRPVIEAAARFGLAPICGSAPDIGAVGYLTGGGIGPLARSFGVSSDHVRALTVVVGSGRVLRATPTENEDLFWGIRGGKATLGIVTDVELDLLPVSTFHGGSVFFSADDAGAVLGEWRELCARLPESGTTSVAVLRLPALDRLPPQIAGRQCVAVRFGWTGDPSDGDDLLRGVRRVADPLLDDVRVRPFTEIGAVHRDPVAPAAVTTRSALLTDLTDAAADRLVTSTASTANRQHIVEVRHLGGAVARESGHRSAVCHRDSTHLLFLSGPADRLTAEQAARVCEGLAPWTSPGLAANFTATDDPVRIDRCYDAETLFWLKELGDHWDPGHVLHTGQVVRHPNPSAPRS